MTAFLSNYHHLLIPMFNRLNLFQFLSIPAMMNDALIMTNRDCLISLSDNFISPFLFFFSTITLFLIKF